MTQESEPFISSSFRHFFGLWPPKGRWYWWVSFGLLLAVGATAVWYFAIRQTPQAPKVDTSNPYAQSIQQLQRKPLPKDPLDQAIYYSQIAQNYETLKESTKAIEYYNKAQAVIDKHGLAQTLAFYRPIGDLYAAQKNRLKARAYYQKEIERLQQYKKDHPDDSGVDTVIKDVQKALSKQ